MKRPLAWQIATVKSLRSETPEVKTLTLALPDWTAHRPGQHYDVRLTAEDGYSAQRSYSVASEPERAGEIDITVERIADGEVSPFLDDTVAVGDRFEVRGPIGGYFVWDRSVGGPLLLVAGGSGVVPLMAMLRHRAAAGITDPARLLYSARAYEQIIYAEELEMLAQKNGLTVAYTLTRTQPSGWKGYARRIDDAMLRDVSGPLGSGALAFICGPTAFVEVSADGLERVGLPAERIRTERFGPSGP
jgi:ferredoxin-NADP reductase